LDYGKLACREGERTMQAFTMIVRSPSFLRWWVLAALFVLVVAAGVVVEWIEIRAAERRADLVALVLMTNDLQRRLIEIHRGTLSGVPPPSGWSTSADNLVREIARAETRAPQANRDVSGSLHEASAAIARTKAIAAGSAADPDGATRRFQREISTALDEIGAVHRFATLEAVAASSASYRITIASRIVTLCALALLAGTLVSKWRMRRVLERAVAQQSALLEAIGGVVVLSVRPDGSIGFWNTQLEIAITRSHDAMGGLHVRDLIVASDLPSFERAVEQVRARNILSVIRARLIGREGEPTLFEWTIKPGWSDGVVTIAGRDVSMSERLLEELRASEERFRHFHQALPVPMFRLQHSLLVDTNPAHCEMLGYTREEMIGQPAAMFSVGNQRERVLEALDGGETLRDFEAQGLRKDGTVLDLLVTLLVIRAPDGSPTGFEGVAIDVTKQRKTEAALRQSEQDYRGIFDNAHDAIVIIDPDTLQIIDANRRALEMYGYTREEFVGAGTIRTLGVITEPEKIGDRLGALRDGAPGDFHSFKTIHRCKDGTLLHVAVNLGVVQYGGRRAFLSMIRDRTRDHFAQERLRESEEKFRLMLDGAVDYAICLTNEKGIVESWNEGAALIFGYAPPEVLGKHIAMFYPDAERQRATPDADLADATENSRSSREGWRVRKGGETFYARSVLNAVRAPAGELRGFALVMQDITEQKRAHDQQQEINAVLSEIAREWTRTFDAVLTPILLADGNGIIHRANAAAGAMAGRDVRDLLGTRLDDLTGEPWSGARDLVREVTETNAPVQKQFRDEHSGRHWDISASAAMELAESRIVLILRDLTEMKRLESDAARGQMWSALGSLVSGIAHEVRNPLFSISSTLDAFQARFGERQEFGPYAVVLRREIERLTHLMRELLDYGRPHSLVLQPACLSDVVREAVRNCAPLLRGSSVRAEVVVEDPIPRIPLDESRMLQVFQNLIENAVQHSPADTCVTLRLRSVNGSAFSGVEAEVRDRGKGFLPDDLPHVLQPFFTRRKGGTGLGLSIVKRIVDDHGGEMTVANDPDGGAVVRVRFALR